MTSSVATMLFEYANPEFVSYLRLSGDILPRPEWGLFFWLFAALLSLAWWWRRPRDYGLLVACAVIAGTYVYSWRWTDEVFINLEHPYNLLHHGRFSFAAHAWVDGTVELVYFLLLTPAAITRATLIRGEYLFGLALALGHLLLLERWLRSCDAGARALALVAFAFFVPFVEVCSSGFGNGLVCLVFFYALTEMAEGRGARGVTAAALLPLLRPDAILYTAVAFWFALLLGERIRRGLLLTAAASLLYFALYRLFYGHFVPTPLLFKAFHWSMVPLLKLRPVCPESAVGWCFDGPPSGTWIPTLAWKVLLSPAALVAYATTLVAFIRERHRPRGRFRTAGLLLLPLAAIAAFYMVTAIGYNPTLFRYYAPFLLLTAVLPLVQLASLVRRELSGWVPAALATVCILGGFALAAYPARHHSRAAGGTLSMAESDRLDDFLFAGELMDRLAPPGWKIGVTEMATFSFANDREIVDLWGYTNRRIATSPVCSEGGVRNHPDVLYEDNPEVVWLRTGVPGALYGFADVPYEEVAILSAGPLSSRFNTMGDPRKLVAHYDLVKLRHFGERTTVLLVRRDLRAAFQQQLDAHGFQLQRSRELDVRSLAKFYEQQPPIQHHCS